MVLRNRYNEHTSIRDINVVGFQIHLRLLERGLAHKQTARLIKKTHSIIKVNPTKTTRKITNELNVVKYISFKFQNE